MSVKKPKLLSKMEKHVEEVMSKVINNPRKYRKHNKQPIMGGKSARAQRFDSGHLREEEHRAIKKGIDMHKTYRKEPEWEKD